MEEFVSQLIASGPTGIICAALVYVIISLQRNKTSERRDNETEALNTRITILENDNKLLHNQLDTVGVKLDKILDELCEIKIALAGKKDKD
jgi:hypothetical protein